MKVKNCAMKLFISMLLSLLVVSITGCSSIYGKGITRIPDGTWQIGKDDIENGKVIVFSISNNPQIVTVTNPDGTKSTMSYLIEDGNIYAINFGFLKVHVNVKKEMGNYKICNIEDQSKCRLLYKIKG